MADVMSFNSGHFSWCDRKKVANAAPSVVTIGCKLWPVSQEMWQFDLNMNIEGRIWRHAVTSRCDVINIKSTFSGIICNDLAISDVKISLTEMISNFQNGRHFEVWGEILNRKLSPTSNRPCPYLHYFWPRDLVPWPTYLLTHHICGPSLVMICQSVHELCLTKRTN